MGGGDGGRGAYWAGRAARCKPGTSAQAVLAARIGPAMPGRAWHVLGTAVIFFKKNLAVGGV